MSCVYFIRHKNTKPIKIGYTEKETPEDRIASMETGSPFGIELLGFIKSSNAKRLEIELHKEYSSRRVKGEWFNLTEEEVKSILREHDVSNITSLRILKAFLVKESLTPKEVIDIVKWHKQYNSPKPKNEETAIVSKEDFGLAIHKVYEKSFIPKKEKITKSNMIGWLCKELYLSRAPVYRYVKKYESFFFKSSKDGRKAYVTLREGEEE